jgi:hypothetical protein
MTPANIYKEQKGLEMAEKHGVNARIGRRGNHDEHSELYIEAVALHKILGQMDKGKINRDLFFGHGHTYRIKSPLQQQRCPDKQEFATERIFSGTG